MTIDEIRKATEYEVDVIRIMYESEVRREESLIQQAGRMQSAFAFSTAALFMGMPMIFEFKGELSFWFVFAMASSITMILMMSLFASLMAQNRRNLVTFPNGKEFLEYIEKKEALFDSEEKRNKYLAALLAELQESLSASNDKRVYWVVASMNLFYSALIACALWFIAAMNIIFS